MIACNLLNDVAMKHGYEQCRFQSIIVLLFTLDLAGTFFFNFNLNDIDASTDLKYKSADQAEDNKVFSGLVKAILL